MRPKLPSPSRGGAGGGGLVAEERDRAKPGESEFVSSPPPPPAPSPRGGGGLAGEPEAFFRRQVVIAQVGDQTERMRGIVLLLSFQNPAARSTASAALQRHPPAWRTKARLPGSGFAGRRRDAPARRGGRAGFAPRP